MVARRVACFGAVVVLWSMTVACSTQKSCGEVSPKKIGVVNDATQHSACRVRVRLDADEAVQLNAGAAHDFGPLPPGVHVVTISSEASGDAGTPDCNVSRGRCEWRSWDEPLNTVRLTSNGAIQVSCPEDNSAYRAVPECDEEKRGSIAIVNDARSSCTLTARIGTGSQLNVSPGGVERFTDLAVADHKVFFSSNNSSECALDGTSECTIDVHGGHVRTVTVTSSGEKNMSVQCPQRIEFSSGGGGGGGGGTTTCPGGYTKLQCATCNPQTICCPSGNHCCGAGCGCC